jgi:4-diphosphocytidyl-2-C-methyl-D-erythritol kinase
LTDTAARSPSLTLAAPAKINLVLELLGPRDDGYTELETIYQSIELGDQVALSPAASGVFLDDDGGVGGPPERNLAVRAAGAWLEAAGRPGGVRLRLTKHVPARAGLGGGSADAAAVLRGLERLYGPRVAPSRTAELAAALGADVPFLLVGGLAIGRGRGERLEPLEDLRGWHVLLARAGEGLSTAEVFSRARRSLTPRSQAPTIQRFVKYIRSGQCGQPPLWNGLAPAACELAPAIGGLIEQMEGMGVATAMTGSGSAVFGLFPEAETAERARDRLIRAGAASWARVTRTLGRDSATGGPG